MKIISVNLFTVAVLLKTTGANIYSDDSLVTLVKFADFYKPFTLSVDKIASKFILCTSVMISSSPSAGT